MANKVVLVDTSILIDYYRKTEKEKTVWINLVRRGYSFTISSVTKYEIYTGAMPAQISFWNSVLQAIPIIALDEASVDVAVELNQALEKKRKQIELADLFIAATSVAYNLPLATLNKKYFSRIDTLVLID